MDKQSLEHGISGTAPRFHSNRLPQKYDFISLGDKGAIVYTQAYLQWDKYCNETLRGANKEIVLTAIRDIEYLFSNFKQFDGMFALITVVVEDGAWPMLEIEIANKKTRITFTIDFHNYFTYKVKKNESNYGISNIRQIILHVFGEQEHGYISSS